MNALFELQKNEEILLKTRKHWFVGCLEVLPTAIGGLIITGALISIWEMGIIPFDISGAYIYFAAGILLQLTWCGTFALWVIYYLDVWVITNHRVVNCNQKDIFDRDTTVWRLDRVQEISTEVQNIFQTLLGYGTIEVQTAGSSATDFAMMEGIRNPELVMQTLQAAADRFANEPKHVTVDAPEKV